MTNTGSRWSAVVLNVLSAALLLWIHLGDLRDASSAANSPVAAMTSPPNAAAAWGVVIATGLLGAVAAWALLAREGARARGPIARLLPIFSVVVLFVEALVLPSARVPLDSDAQTALTLEMVAERARRGGADGGLVTLPHELASLVNELPAPPYLAHGTRVKAWSVNLVPGCEGPASSPGDAGVATFFYCLSAAGDRAWVSVLALPERTRFGAPAFLTRGGRLVAAEVASPPPETDEGPAPSSDGPASE